MGESPACGDSSPLSMEMNNEGLLTVNPIHPNRLTKSSVLRCV